MGGNQEDRALGLPPLLSARATLMKLFNMYLMSVICQALCHRGHKQGWLETGLSFLRMAISIPPPSHLRLTM